MIERAARSIWEPAWWLTPAATLVILRGSVKRGSQPRSQGLLGVLHYLKKCLDSEEKQPQASGGTDKGEKKDGANHDCSALCGLLMHFFNPYPLAGLAIRRFPRATSARRSGIAAC